MTLLSQAAQIKGFRSPSLAETNTVLIEIPRSFRKRRASSLLIGSVSQTDCGTEIIWTCGDNKHRSKHHLLSLEEALPAGTLHYQGIVEAVTASGLVFEGKTIFPNVVDTLGYSESVVAIGTGRLGNIIGVLGLTDQRLLFVEDGILGPQPLLDAPLRSLKALALGKKVTVETLKVVLAQAAILISHMGHSEGHGIAAKFRELRHERTRPRSSRRTLRPSRSGPTHELQFVNRPNHVLMPRKQATHQTPAVPGVFRPDGQPSQNWVRLRVSEAERWASIVDNADESIAPLLASGCRFCRQRATTSDH